MYSRHSKTVLFSVHFLNGILVSVDPNNSKTGHFCPVFGWSIQIRTISEPDKFGPFKNRTSPVFKC